MNDNNIVLKTDTGDVEIPFTNLTKAKLILSDELIKATGNKQETA
jgi:ribosome maturation factor RimP